MFVLHFFDGFCSFLDVCGCGLWWFGYEWGLSAGGFQSICCCFCSRVFKSYFTWDCTGDYLRLYLRCLWYLRETILEILFGFFVWNHVSFYLSTYLYIYYIACDCTKRFTVILKSNTKTMHEIHWCTAVACKTHLKNRRKFFQDRWIRIYIYVWNLLWDLPGAKEAYEHTDWIYISIDEATKRIYIGSWL